EHHQSHAAATFLAAPPRAAAILTADGVGEWATLSLGRGAIHEDGSTELRTAREIRFPHSLGMLYSTFTAWLGFPVNEGEYKVMGLAAYGRPSLASEVRKVLLRTKDGGFALALSYFDYHLSARSSYSAKFVDAFGPARDPWDPIDLATDRGRHYAEVAASVQRVLEDTLVDLATALHAETGLPDLCLGGGVALNGVANARILRESGFERVFVPSAPGDAGCALGAALFADRVHFGRPHVEVPDPPFWGPEIDEAELLRIAAGDDRPVELPPGGARLGRSRPGAVPVGRECRDRLAAIPHVDGTARGQTVDPLMAPRFHALLHAYGALSGMPVLLNTSFNLAGEPIVNRSIEGYSTFRRSGIDLLVAGSVLVERRAPEEVKAWHSSTEAS